MPEIAAFVKHGATLMTPVTLEKVMKQIPMWKASFTQIHADNYPHLVDQLMFLASLVEDVGEGAYKDLPYVTLSEAMFALIYSQRSVDIIPDTIPKFGFADESSVVRAVLIHNERPLMAYAKTMHRDWKNITNRP